MKHLLRSPILCERIPNLLGHAAVGAAVHSRATLVTGATGRRCLAGTSLRSTPALLIDARGGFHFNMRRKRIRRTRRPWNLNRHPD